MSKEIPLSKGKFAVVDDDDFDYLNQFKWYCSSHGYARRRVLNKDNREKGSKISMHRVINQTPEGMYTDHINMDKLDNRKVNLRTATKPQNGMNRNSYNKTSSQFKGVCWHKCNKKWTAQIQINGKLKYLGCFIKEKTAAMAYDIAAIQYFGEYARTNF